MKFQDFLKELFDTESVKGYEIGKLEISVGVVDGSIVVFDDIPSKVTIVPTDGEVERLRKELAESNAQITTLSRKLIEPPNLVET